MKKKQVKKNRKFTGVFCEKLLTSFRKFAENTIEIKVLLERYAIVSVKL